KMPIAVWNMTLRPYRSDSLPQIGVDAVEVSRVAETTQASCSWPPSSPTMVGRAVATIVWDRAATSMPSMRPASTVRIWEWLRTGTAAVAGPAATGAAEPLPAAGGSGDVTRECLPRETVSRPRRTGIRGETHGGAVT